MVTGIVFGVLFCIFFFIVSCGTGFLGSLQNSFEAGLSDCAGRIFALSFESGNSLLELGDRDQFLERSHSRSSGAPWGIAFSGFEAFFPLVLTAASS